MKPKLRIYKLVCANERDGEFDTPNITLIQTNYVKRKE